MTEPELVREILSRAIAGLLACPICGSAPSVTGTAHDDGWLASCSRGNHVIELWAKEKPAAIARWNRLVRRETPAA